MLLIGMSSGALTWDNTTITATTSLYELLKLNHEAYLSWQSYSGFGQLWQMYHLPSILIEDQVFGIRLHYLRQRLGGIGITRDSPPPLEEQLAYSDDEADFVLSDEYDEYEDVSSAVQWSKVAKQLLEEQLGRPLDSHPVTLPNQYKPLSQSEKDLLALWSYRFKWGYVQYKFDWMEQQAGIGLGSHNGYEKLESWDELIADYESAIEVEKQWGAHHQIEMKAARDLASQLSKHFPFSLTKPIWNPLGIAFNAASSPTAGIKVEIDYPKQQYIFHDAKSKEECSVETIDELITVLRSALRI